MSVKRILSQVAVSAVLLWTGVANAALYQFNLAGDYTAQWKLDSNVTPGFSLDGAGFSLYDVEGFPDALFSVVNIHFYSAANSGGLAIEDPYLGVPLLLSNGPQLYTGTEDSPVFKLGTFALTEYQGSGSYTLNISNISPVPEPATYGLLLAGLGLVGATLRRRRQH